MHVKILISSPNRKKFLIRIQSLYSGRGFIFTSSLSSGNILQNVTSSLQLLNSCVNQKVYSGNAQSPFHTCMWSKDVDIKKTNQNCCQKIQNQYIYCFTFRSFRLKLKVEISFKHKERSLVSTFQLFVKKNV